MREVSYTLDFPGALGSVTQTEYGWTWSVSYSDGSGVVSDWCPTKRGAQICAVNEARRISGNYGKVKWIWIYEGAA